MPRPDPLPSLPEAASTPRVSAIVPLFNCLALTQAMLESLLATWPPEVTREIIFVDDGSTDGTREWLATLGSGYRIIRNERNLGYAAANNRGAAIARGEFLVLLNNDLVLTPRWLEPMLAAHARLGGDKAGAIGNVQLNARTGEIDHAGIFFNHKGKPEHARELRAPWVEFVRLYDPVDAVTGACLLIARGLWERLGGFDEGYANGGEDVDLCLRARSAGLANAVVWRSRVRHHVSASPGRKQRDEENTRRFVSRWRRELVDCSVRQWTRHYVATCSLHPRDHEFSLAWGILLYALGISRHPPSEALVRTEAAIDAELVRWEKILGPIPTQP